MNQDSALSLWREDAARNDPALYTVCDVLGDGQKFMWLSVGQNIGWFKPVVEKGELVGIRSIALPQASQGDLSDEHARKLDYALKFVGEKQARKIVEMLEAAA